MSHFFVVLFPFVSHHTIFVNSFWLKLRASSGSFVIRLSSFSVRKCIVFERGCECVREIGCVCVLVRTLFVRCHVKRTCCNKVKTCQWSFIATFKCGCFSIKSNLTGNGTNGGRVHTNILYCNVSVCMLACIDVCACGCVINYYTMNVSSEERKRERKIENASKKKH